MEMTPESMTAEVFVSHPFCSMYLFFHLNQEKRYLSTAWAFFPPKGFPCIVPRSEESNLFWNKGKKAGGEMQRELWEFPTENIINKRTICSLHTLLFGCVRQTVVIIKNQ